MSVSVRSKPDAVVTTTDMDRSDVTGRENPPVDEKGNPLDMPPEYFEVGEQEPVYERIQPSQNLWHHYAVR